MCNELLQTCLVRFRAPSNLSSFAALFPCLQDGILHSLALSESNLEALSYLVRPLDLAFETDLVTRCWVLLSQYDLDYFAPPLNGGAQAEWRRSPREVVVQRAQATRVGDPPIIVEVSPQSVDYLKRTLFRSKHTVAILACDPAADLCVIRERDLDESRVLESRHGYHLMRFSKVTAAFEDEIYWMDVKAAKRRENGDELSIKLLTQSVFNMQRPVDRSFSGLTTRGIHALRAFSGALCNLEPAFQEDMQSVWMFRYALPSQILTSIVNSRRLLHKLLAPHSSSRPRSASLSCLQRSIAGWRRLSKTLRQLADGECSNATAVSEIDAIASLEEAMLSTFTEDVEICNSR